MNKTFFIRTLLILGIIISILLIITDIVIGKYCAYFIFIPACYLVLIAFVGTLGGEILKNLNIYYGFSLLGLILVINFSFQEIVKGNVCPTFLKLPLCYVSLLTFAILIILKWNQKNKKVLK